MVYYAIETTYFGLYCSSSGFYSIKEESKKAVEKCEGVLIKRSLHQSPDHSVPSAKAICKHGKIYKHGEIYKQRKFTRRCGDGGGGGYSLWGCINFETGSGYCIRPLYIFGGPPLSVTLVVSCGGEENPVCESKITPV